MGARDEERVRAIQRALTARGWQALVCALPSNVLLLSGYWPMVGTAIALFTASGRIGVVAPEDEHDLAKQGWADEVQFFSGASLGHVTSLAESVLPKLAEVGRRLGLCRGSVVAIESEAHVQAAPYVALNVYGPEFVKLLGDALPGAEKRSAEPMLQELRSALTPREVARTANSCAIAERAFQEAARWIHAGATEIEVAARARVCLQAGVPGRADGAFFCMSGPNAAQAKAAYQRSRCRQLETGDLVLLHCNSTVDGFWTDITRTFVVGEADEGQQAMYQAVFAARNAALKAIRPGVRAASVDRAAREVMEACGFGRDFPHATGHGVGYSAINHRALPRIHPESPDVLEVGSTFNIEPAIYLEGYGGLRHCDVVTVTADGAQVLTPYLSRIGQLQVLR